MFVSERLENILAIINKAGKVEVNELSKNFKVSKDLIRKDLSRLEEDGFIERTYGGAIKKRHNAETVTVVSRIYKNLEVKKKIAQKALQEIKKDDTIFLDISSINYILASEILKNGIEVTIVTNMIDVMHLFSMTLQNKVQLIGIGGACNALLDGFVGIAAIDQINKFNIDKSFIGAIGINLYDGNVSTYDLEDGLTKSAIMNRSKKNYLITEKKKLDQDGKFNFSIIKDFDTIITESSIDQKEINQIKKYKVNVL